MHTESIVAALAIAMLSSAVARAEPIREGLMIRQLDQAYRAAAAASGVPMRIGKPQCSPGMPGFFCSYAVAPGLRIVAGAPTLKSDIDSLAVESTEREASDELRSLLAQTIAVLEPEMPAERRRTLL